MKELNTKIVLHIPEYFHDENGLIHIPVDILQQLYDQLQVAGYDFFISTVETYYHKRTYTTKLVTLYTDNDNKPITIFKKWFKNNNNELNQESMAYEWNDKLIIEEID